LPSGSHGAPQVFAVARQLGELAVRNRAAAVGAPTGPDAGDENFGATVPRLLRPGTGRAVREAARLAHKPREPVLAQAATILAPAVTAWQMLFEHGRLERGETVVVLGADRSVGAHAVQ